MKSMKRLFFASLAMVMSVAVYAKSDVEGFINFVLNDNNKVEIVRDYATTQSLEQIVDNINRFICADDGSLEPISEGKYNCKFQSQSYYNPFAGATNRHLSFVLEVSTDGNMAHIVLSNLIVDDNYVGYGVNSKKINVTYQIQDYNDILNKYNQSTNKKEKKEFASKLEEIEDVLRPSDEELNNRLNKLVQVLD